MEEGLMTSKHLGPRRRWLAWAAATAGLVAITAVAASSMAGAAPFIPAVPGAEHSRQLDASAVLDQLEFPVEYASEGSSGNNCGATPVLEANCKRVAELFTLTKRVDHTTPILAQSSASGKPRPRSQARSARVALVPGRTARSGPPRAAGWST